MGSQLTKNYEVDKDPCSSGGLCNMWKIYKGHKRDKMRTPVSIFIFEKKSLDKIQKNSREPILNILRKEPTSLARFKHPMVLSIIEPLLEDTKSMAYVTERVESSLACLKDEFIPSELEIKTYAFELCEALTFFHALAKTVHLAISPENVYLNQDGKLKMAGFIFAQQFTTSELEPCTSIDLSGATIHECMIPNLKFTAPEVTTDLKCSMYSDVFSLGCLLYFLIQSSKTSKKGGSDPYLIKLYDNTNPRQHSQECKSLEMKKSSLLASLGDQNLALGIDRMLNIRAPKMRGESNDILNNSWFNDPMIKALSYLEKLNEKELNNKVQFLNGLSKILDNFEEKVLARKILPCLVNALQDEQLSSSVLPCIMKILEKGQAITPAEFQERVWPALERICKGREMPAQSLYMILRDTEAFFKYVDIRDFQAVMLPLHLKSLECGVPKLQEIALQKIPFLSKKLEYTVVKTQLLPRVLHMMTETKLVQLKVECLVCIKEFIAVIDRSTLSESVLQALEKLRKTENDGRVCMLILELYESASKILGSDVAANRLLPNMIPILVSGALSKEQFKQYVASIKRMLDNIESSRTKELEESSTSTIVDKEGFNFNQFSQNDSTTTSTTSKGGNDFDFLDSLDKKPTPAPVTSTIVPEQPRREMQGNGPKTLPFEQLQKNVIGAQANDLNTLFGATNLNEEKKGNSNGWDLGDDFLSSLGGTNQTKAPNTNTGLSGLGSLSGFGENPTAKTHFKTTSQGGNQSANLFGGMQLSGGLGGTQPQNTFGGPQQTNTFKTALPSNVFGGTQQSNNMGGGFGAQKKGNLANMSDDPFAEVGLSPNRNTFDHSRPVSQPGFPIQTQQPQAQFNMNSNLNSLDFNSLGGGGFMQPQQPAQTTSSFSFMNSQPNAYALNSGPPYMQQNPGMGSMMGSQSMGLIQPQQQQQQPLGGMKLGGKPAPYSNNDDFFTQIAGPQNNNVFDFGGNNNNTNQRKDPFNW